jgi:hypothetical protein
VYSLGACWGALLLGVKLGLLLFTTYLFSTAHAACEPASADTCTVWNHCFAEAGEPSALQQQRSRALQLCSQLQRAALLAQQQCTASNEADDSLSGSMQLPRSSSGRSSSSSGFSTARTVLALLDSNRDVLDAMPKVGTVWVSIPALPHMQRAARQQAPVLSSLHSSCARQTTRVSFSQGSCCPCMAGKFNFAAGCPRADDSSLGGSWLFSTLPICASADPHELLAYWATLCIL